LGRSNEGDKNECTGSNTSSTQTSNGTADDQSCARWGNGYKKLVVYLHFEAQ
jgi:hypothetical protein